MGDENQEPESRTKKEKLVKSGIQRLAPQISKKTVMWCDQFVFKPIPQKKPPPFFTSKQYISS